MEFKTKRRFSFVVINIFMFFGGIEYGKTLGLRIDQIFGPFYETFIDQIDDIEPSRNKSFRSILKNLKSFWTPIKNRIIFLHFQL